LNSTRLNDRNKKLVLNTTNASDLSIPMLGITGYGTSTNA